MAEVKNSFLRSKMNKDLDDRLMPEGEYRDAKNISINKSQGDGSSEGNVGTAQTVLGNTLLIDFNSSIPSSPVNLEVIGLLPSDAQDKIFAFLTNNIIQPYVPEGAIGLSYLYPENQGAIASILSLVDGGEGYSGVTATSSGGSGTGMSFNAIATGFGGTITGISINNSGTGYQVGDVVNVIQAGGSNAYVELTSVEGSIKISAVGAGYTEGTKTTTGGSGSGLTVSITVNGTGGVTAVNIVSFGGGYQIGDVITIVDPSSTTPATLTVLSLLQSYSAIVSYNPVLNTDFKIIVEGSWLNFSTLAPFYALNLIEELLFFTDNRNQPRKVNINNPSGYYSNEDQISVAKYYPYEAIEVYQPCPIPGTIGTSVNPVHEADSFLTTNSATLNFDPATYTPAGDPTNLGVVGNLASSIVGGTGYTAGSGILTSGSLGRGLTVTIVVAAGVVTGVTIDNLGNGYTNGETITILSGNNDATFVLNFILPQTFVVNGSNFAAGDVIVNQNQTVPAGMELDFVEPETTLQDAVAEYLSPTATSLVGATAVPTTTSFDLTVADYQGYFDDGGASSSMFGYTVFLEISPGVFESQNSQVTALAKTGAGTISVTCSPALAAPFVAGDKVLLAIPNPYFDSNFKSNANIEYLSDKFARFSYRYRFDDGEYSLIAPFTQPCFIPEQDGYFTSNIEGSFSGGTENIVSDEEQAYRSTEVAFMENKVNKILLNIPLPSTAGNLFTNFKVSEIDILYKESDQTTIKVVETIPTTNNVSGSSNFYQYEYGSKQPFKVLPQVETTRVYDKVPVKALSQEVASNRVIYGNYQDKHTPPSFLDYTLNVDIKGGTNQQFSVSKNKVDSKTSVVEYPNATLKQNRNYEVGVVLADRFGRQSTVIFSKQSKFASLGEFLASSIYSPYRGPNETSPTTGIQDFDGNALNIQFNDLIRSQKDPNNPGIPGLYNSDQTSPDYNPLGWYSFKIVVKQTEQDYYNVYIPAAMASYPLNRELELGSTSHIILTNDNVNKIPRDLSEVGPTQREFPSSVRLFGRVNTGGVNSTDVDENEAYFPSRVADLSTSVGTIQDLFNYKEFPTLALGNFVFYNYEYVSTPGTTPSGTDTSFPDSSSLVARINTQSQFGIQVPTPGGKFTQLPALNVFETAPTVSLLDIYYETTTAGRIDLLNTAIDEGPAPSQFGRISDFEFFATEGTPAGSDVSDPFKPLRLDGTDFPNPAANQMILLSVVDGLGSSANPADLGTPTGTPIPYFDSDNPANGIFDIAAGSIAGTFKLVLSRPAGNESPGLVFRAPLASQAGESVTAQNEFTFTFECSNPGAGADAEPTIISVTKTLVNVIPPKPVVTNFRIPVNSLCVNDQFPNIGLTVPALNQLDPATTTLPFFPEIARVTFENGSETTDLHYIDCFPEIEQIFIKVPASPPGYINGWLPLSVAVDYFATLGETISGDFDAHVYLDSQVGGLDGVGTYYLKGGPSVLTESSATYGLPYLVNIVTRDAGTFPGAPCHTLFQIVAADQTISFDPDDPVGVTIPDCKDGSTSLTFSLDNDNGLSINRNTTSQIGIQFPAWFNIEGSGPITVEARLDIVNIAGSNPGPFSATANINNQIYGNSINFGAGGGTLPSGAPGATNSIVPFTIQSTGGLGWSGTVTLSLFSNAFPESDAFAPFALAPPQPAVGCELTISFCRCDGTDPDNPTCIST